MTPKLPKLKATTILAARAAGAILAKNFGKKLQVSEKKDAGLVTNVDLAAEEAAIRILRRSYPDFAFLTEETNPTIQGSEGRSGRWVLDPLDGTTNYVHGFPMFCVSIGAQWEGNTLVGVIYHPILDDLYVAVRGQGATLNGKKIHVSSTRKLEDSLLTTGFTYRKKKWLDTEMDAFERLSGITRAIRRPGSAAMDLAYTARGVFDGFWERNLSPWDTAAGALLVEEAGGKVTDFSGKIYRVEKKEIVASNRALHSALMEAVSI